MSANTREKSFFWRPAVVAGLLALGCAQGGSPEATAPEPESTLVSETEYDAAEDGLLTRTCPWGTGECSWPEAGFTGTDDVWIPVSSGLTPLVSGKPVTLVITPEVGVPRAGVTSTGLFNVGLVSVLFVRVCVPASVTGALATSMTSVLLA
jgi:hypothetical protein